MISTMYGVGFRPFSTLSGGAADLKAPFDPRLVAPALEVRAPRRFASNLVENHVKSMPKTLYIVCSIVQYVLYDMHSLV